MADRTHTRFVSGDTVGKTPVVPPVVPPEVLLDKGALFSKEMLEGVGAARQYVATELHNKRNLEQAAVFLQVYNEAVVSIDTLQHTVGELRQQVDTLQKSTADLALVYQKERDRYDALTKEAQQQHGIAVAKLTQKLEYSMAVHNKEMAALQQQSVEATEATRSVISELHSKVANKRKELAEVTEQYDKVAALLHGVARQMSPIQPT